MRDMQNDYSFIHTDWYQTFFSEPAPYRWLWRCVNTWLTEECLSAQTPENIDEYIARRLLCTIHEPSYQKRKRAVKSKQKYNASFQNNKETLRQKILERDGDVCAICGRKLNNDLSIDHIDNTMLPDGSLNSDIENLRLTHARCNSLRSKKQNRSQNRAWNKARKNIASLHNVRADHIGKSEYQLRKKRYSTRSAESARAYYARRNDTIITSNKSARVAIPAKTSVAPKSVHKAPTTNDPRSAATA